MADQYFGGAFKTINRVFKRIGSGCDLMQLIHSQFDTEEKNNSNSYKGRMMHITSTKPHEFDDSKLLKTMVKGWQLQKFQSVKKTGLLEDTYLRGSKHKPITVEDFIKKFSRPAFSVPKTKEELNDLWKTIQEEPLPYKIDLGETFQDNRVSLKDFDNPLKFICDKYGLELLGMHDAYTLIGVPGTSSPSHFEDNEFGSINKLLKGLALWVSVDASDNLKLAQALAKLTRIECNHLLESKAYIALPAFLDSHGINYYLALQRPGDIIVTFPGAIHLVFNLEITVKEAINFLPVRWLEPCLDHQYCRCPITRPKPAKLGFAIHLEHGQSLEKQIFPSRILKEVFAWLNYRYRNGDIMRGMFNPAYMVDVTSNAQRQYRHFGTDKKAFKDANRSNKKYFCKVCYDDGVSMEDAQMKKSAYYRHISARHLETVSTFTCDYCDFVAGDGENSYKDHSCVGSKAAKKLKTK